MKKYISAIFLLNILRNYFMQHCTVSKHDWGREVSGAHDLGK